MRWVVAPLAAALLASVALAACGGNGAEPGASREATLVLDFQPNAVHSGIYTALERGYYEDEGVELEVREPSASSDAPKLLEAGRADFAILDIHDLGLAAEEGHEIAGVMPIVQRPLASVIARSDAVARPRELEGGRVGVTGLPSDDAVLDSVVEADGGDPRAVDRVTIGFNAVSALAGGKVDAATGFWSAEGLALRREGVPITEFRVDDYGAPSYPELVLVASRDSIDRDPDLIEGVVRGTARGYEATLDDPQASLDDLLAAVPDLDRATEETQLEALEPALRPVGRFDDSALRAWARWDVEHGIVEREPNSERLFEDRFLP
jgi:putative hydroxymethylpyrimidine transport system substrate-binding protein